MKRENSEKERNITRNTTKYGQLQRRPLKTGREKHDLSREHPGKQRRMQIKQQEHIEFEFLFRTTTMLSGCRSQS